MKKYFLPFGLMLALSLSSCAPSPQAESSTGPGEPVVTELPDTEDAAKDFEASIDDREDAADTGPDTATDVDINDTADTDFETATDTDVDAPRSSLPKIGTYTRDELTEVDGGGCGMSLSRATGGDNLFSSGLDGDAFMVFDDQLTPLGRTAASGGIDFYGQQTAQTFITSDGEITVQVDVILGAPGEIEGVNIPEGTLRIKGQGETLEIPVVGGAGC